MEYLARQGDYLLTNLFMLSRCCCDGTETVPEGDRYFEAVPCDAYFLPGDSCYDITQCVFDQRMYANTTTLCQQTEEVCECQKLVIYSWNDIPTYEDQAAYFYAGFGCTQGTGVVTTGSLILSSRHSGGTIFSREFLYSDYNTFDELMDDVVDWNPSGSVYPFEGWIWNAHPNGAPDTLATGIFLCPDFSTDVFVGMYNKIWIVSEGQRSSGVLLGIPQATFAANLQTAITTSFPSLNGIQVYADDRAGLGSTEYFYIVFSSGLCGEPQDNLGLEFTLGTPFGYPTEPQILYGNYVNGFGAESTENYNLVPNQSSGCPYELSSYTPNDRESGYAAYSTGIQCCPQRGAVVSSPQLPPNYLTYGSDLSRVENTIKYGDTCFKITPYHFIFGKEGKFHYDSQYRWNYYIQPDCVFGSGGLCEYDLPCNCAPELLITFFSNEAPWGPYGAYYQGIETHKHPAYTNYLNSDSYLYDENYMAREAFSGWRYAPSGMMKTVGTWQNTTNIILEFEYYKYVPYYVGTGTPSGAIDKVIGTVTSLGAFTVVTGNVGINPTILSYAVDDDTTVGQFLDAANAIRTTDVDGESCQLFNFCAASPTARDMKLKYINNVSSELYDVWRMFGTGDASSKISDPAIDSYGYSAGTIFPAPKRYDTLRSTGPTASGPNRYNTPSVNVPAEFPPPCRRTNRPPKYQGFHDSIFRRQCFPYWRTKQGCYEDLITISKYAGSVDPDMTDLTVEVDNRELIVKAYSSMGFYAYGSVNTNFGGSGYTLAAFASGVNNLVLNNYTGTGTFRPLQWSNINDKASTIFLDDGTYLTVSGLPVITGAVATPINWGYLEPLEDQDEQSIFPAGTGYTIGRWIRRKCDSLQNYSVCNTGELPRCVPPDSISIELGTRLNCDGDNFYDRGWLVTYGCHSYNCKTQYYIRANRCACSTAPACHPENGSLTYLDHPVNRKEADDCSKLSQPTFYMCEQNLLSQCDIPFLIKVPYQYTCVTGNPNCYFGDCWRDPNNSSPCQVAPCPTTGVANDISLIGTGIQVGYLQPDNPSCQAGYVDYCVMNNGYAGWCQYIDPASLIKVRKEDIPREWPPEAIVMNRTLTPFCSTFINEFDQGDEFGCQFGKYDSLADLIPWVPYEYLIPEGYSRAGYPCFMAEWGTSIPNILWAYIRPMVDPLPITDVCASGVSCGVLDIGCNTRCCYCGYKCDGGCPTNGPVRGCSYTETANSTFNSFTIAGCNFITPSSIVDIPGFGHCNIASHHYCDTNVDQPNPVLYPPVAACFDGEITETRTMSFTRTRSYDIVAGYGLDFNGDCYNVYTGPGCCWNSNGEYESVIDRNFAGCTSECWCPGCDGGCSGVSGACGDGSTPCVTTTTTLLGCGTDISVYIPQYSESSGLIGAENDCGAAGLPSCGAGRAPHVGVAHFSETYRQHLTTNDYDTCGFGTTNFTDSQVTYLDGESQSGMECDEETVQLGYINVDAQFGVGYGCACGAWSPPWVYRGDGPRYEHNGSYTVTDNGCSSCSFDSIERKTYEYISQFVIEWECGMSGSVSTEASGTLYVP